MEAAVIVTYRCQNKCYMCNIWQHPTKLEEEIKPDLLNKLPDLKFCNITGGEPFLRDDMDKIISIVKKKAKRIVISTSGYFTEKTLDLAKKHPDIGFRISLEGLPAANDQLRGMKDCFDHGLRTLLGLSRLGVKDIGFGVTVSDDNAKDMLELYQLAKLMKVEFATAVVHNSYYFHKQDNQIKDPTHVSGYFVELINELLATNRIKNWFRAYFNYGLIHRIQKKGRLLPCGAGEDMFFLDPWGEIRPCNGLKEGTKDNSMGNLNQDVFWSIWNSQHGQAVRASVKNCPRHCWMIGTASPAMKKELLKPLTWVLKHKLRALLGKPFVLGEKN